MKLAEEIAQPIGGTLYLGAGDRARTDAPSQSSMDSDESPSKQLCQTILGRDDLSGLTFGQYQLKDRLGQGGMGVIYRATHLHLEKDFAIKFIASEMSGNTEACERFIKEFKSLGQLHHPNIISAVDAGSVDGIAFYVTELLSGCDLASWIAQRPLPNLTCVSELIRQGALGLEHAHLHGLLHRDIKPSNLFLETNGNVKLLDFGLVRSNGDPNGVTRSNQIMGTIDYMSPEQAENPQSCTPASDIYSLGATLLYPLSGTPPFPDKDYPTAVSKLRGHLADVPIWLKTEGPSLPNELRIFLTAMLAKSPKDRPQSAIEVANTLSNWSNAADLAAWINGAQSEPAITPQHRKPIQNPNVRFATKSTKWLWSCITAICFLCVAIAIVMAQFPLLSSDPIAPAGSRKNDNDDSDPLTTSVKPETVNARALRFDTSSSGQPKQNSFAPRSFSTRD